MLLFFLGTLLGIILGGTLCVAYLRQEIAASIGPKLGHLKLQLDTIENELILARAAQPAELSARLLASVPRQMPEHNTY